MSWMPLSTSKDALEGDEVMLLEKKQDSCCSCSSDVQEFFSTKGEGGVQRARWRKYVCFLIVTFIACLILLASMGAVYKEKERNDVHQADSVGPVTPVAILNYTEQVLSLALSFPAGSALFGTMTYPYPVVQATAAAKVPVGVIIAGSGPTDRNGNTNTSSSITNVEEHSNAYLFLAHDLAELGIATLRYDKRGVGASVGAMRGITEAQLVFTNFSQDALQFALHVKAVTEAPCVWLFGHSEGALHAQVAAYTALSSSSSDIRSSICGISTISGAGRNASSLLKAQLAAAVSKLGTTCLGQSEAAIDLLAQGRTFDPSTSLSSCPLAFVQQLFRASVQPYEISWFAQDPVVVMASLKKLAPTFPILVTQGTDDAQVSVYDAELLYAAAIKGSKSSASANLHLVNSSNAISLLQGDNHVLKFVNTSTDAALLTRSHTDGSWPIDGRFATTLREFVFANN